MKTADVAQHLASAFNKHDPSEFAAKYTENALVYDPFYPEPISGRAAIQQDINDLMRAFPDAHSDVEKVLAEGETAAIKVEMTGTHKGPLTLPEGEVPATGRKISLPFASFLRCNRQNQVVEEHRFYDVTSMMRQLGLSP